MSMTPSLFMPLLYVMQASVSPSSTQAWWSGLSALLNNVGAYYGQFAPAVQAALKKGLSALEKQLQVCTRFYVCVILMGGCALPLGVWCRLWICGLVMQ